MTLSLLAILSVLVVPTYLRVQGGLEEEKQTIILSGYVVKARSIASAAGNQYRYPADVVAQLTALDAKITSGGSNSPGIISARRIDDATILMALVNDQGWCYAILDSTTTDTQTYAYDKTTTECNAADIDHIEISGTQGEPNAIDIP
jgi:type II secretory pathway pseudopilin PulG